MVIRRRITLGARSADGAKFTAFMQSVVNTLSIHHGFRSSPVPYPLRRL